MKGERSPHVTKEECQDLIVTSVRPGNLALIAAHFQFAAIDLELFDI